ncbi:MAG: cupin-like domain-containing protein [Cellvibrionaceae bacterium]
MFDKLDCREVTRESKLSPRDFIANFKKPAKPVILSDATRDWPAKEKWDIDYLSDVAGDKVVPVYSSRRAEGKSHQHAAAANMKMSEYLKLLKQGENDLRMFFYNILHGAPVLTKDFSYPKIGLWFFKRLPVLFVGGKGARVQMHYDIDLSDLLLCHFGGKKHVLLIPPEQTPYMYKVPYSFSTLYDVDFENPDFTKHPALKHLNAYSAVLNHGDALYIPSGYWHYIIYEDIGFSLTLRSFPSKLLQQLTILKNIFYTRNIEGLMRKLVGQPWNDRNEKLAIEITHKNLKGLEKDKA